MNCIRQQVSLRQIRFKKKNVFTYSFNNNCIELSMVLYFIIKFILNLYSKLILRVCDKSRWLSYLILW